VLPPQEPELELQLLPDWLLDHDVFDDISLLQLMRVDTREITSA